MFTAQKAPLPEAAPASVTSTDERLTTSRNEVRNMAGSNPTLESTGLNTLSVWIAPPADAPAAVHVRWCYARARECVRNARRAQLQGRSGSSFLLSMRLLRAAAENWRTWAAKQSAGQR